MNSSKNATTHLSALVSRRLLARAATLLLTGLALPAEAEQTIRVSVSSAGGEANSISYAPAVSADGRYVAFHSFATNLVPKDRNGAADVFIYEQATHKTTRVSVNSAGGEAKGYSGSAAVSADGRYVAFQSRADNLSLNENLKPNDHNGKSDVFVRDRAAHKTIRVSVDSAGRESNFDSLYPAISADGRYVAFQSAASNLVSGDHNGVTDIFVHDLVTKRTTRVSVNRLGRESNSISSSPAISADGRYIAYTSNANNLVAGDLNGFNDIFVHDQLTHQTTRVSVDSAGRESNGDSILPDISADGRYVAFQSDASNLIIGDGNGIPDIFVHDRASHKTTRVSVQSGKAGRLSANGYSEDPAISADGRYVAFWSLATNLVSFDEDDNGLRDIFVHDRSTQKTTRVSSDNFHREANGESTSPAISGDGRYVAFQSFADNLIADDHNSVNDIFVHDQLFNSAANADLQVTQTVSANPVSKGSSFNYAITVTNLGPKKSGSVTLFDLVPLGGRVNLPQLTSNLGRCAPNLISLCHLGVLAPGQKAKVKVTFQALRAGFVTNKVSVNGSGEDPAPANNHTATSTKIVP